MNKIYLMPKIFILTFIILYSLKTLTWFNILWVLILSIIVVIIGQLLVIYVVVIHYEHLIKNGKHISKEKIHFMIHKIGVAVDGILRININIENMERFDPSKNYLITPNHQSNADAVIMMEVFQHPVVFVAKHSISKIPIVNHWMDLMGCLYLKKDDMRGQITIMKQVEEKLNNKESVIIFPEGKRSFSPTMNNFKPGTFKMATKTKVDILPVTTNHLHKLKHHFPWRATNVNVYFHEPIPYEVYKDMSTQELAEMVQNVVRTKIED